MKYVMICLLSLLLSFITYADKPILHLQQTERTNQQWGFVAKVVTIDKSIRFELLDLPVRNENDVVTHHWDKTQHAVIINGGYFDKYFKPVGYYKINDKLIHSGLSPSLSGLVGINKMGGLALLTTKQLRKNAKKINQIYPTLMQTGPYIIDPDGKIGIQNNNHKRYRRTVIAKTRSGDILLISTKPISLYDLARALKAEIPDIERALNLDGGPSTAMQTATLSIKNYKPVRSYLVGFSR